MRVELTTDTSDPAVLQEMLQWSADLGMLYLLQHPRTPPLYSSGVLYRREPRQVVKAERFCGIGEVLQQGWGDCDDLAPWRAAELSLRGIAARPVLIDASHPTYRQIAGVGNQRVRRSWHVVVERLVPGIEELVYEDPSARLGMYDV